MTRTGVESLCQLARKDRLQYRASSGEPQLATEPVRVVAPPEYFDARGIGGSSPVLGSGEIAEVLRVARKRLVLEGWHPVKSTLFAAVWNQPVSLGRIGARRLLERTGRCYLLEWDLEPLRRKGDAVRLIDSALRSLGVPRVHRGGWVVSGGTR